MSISNGRKVFECTKQQDAAHESMYNDRFRRYMQVLSNNHQDFNPIKCFARDCLVLFFFPCRDFLRVGTCKRFSIRRRLPTNNQQVYWCTPCEIQAKRVSSDASRNQRTAPNSKVPISSLSEIEKEEKIRRMIVERKKCEKS